MNKVKVLTGLTLILLSFSCAKQDEGFAPSRLAESLVISPKTTAMSVNSEVVFSAIGGEGEYEYSIVKGNAQISPETGKLLALEPDEVVVRVTDGNGQYDDAVVLVNPPLNLIENVSYVIYGQSYSLQVSGGTAPFKYTILSGGGQIDLTGGVYTAPWFSGSALIQVEDSAGNIIIAEVISVAPVSSGESMLTLGYGDVHNFVGEGGVPPYSYSIIAGPGTIFQNQGTFIASNWESNSIVKITDSVGFSVEVKVKVTQFPN